MSDSDAKPSWYGTARGPGVKRFGKRPAAPEVLSTVPKPDNAPAGPIDRPRWYGTACEHHDENGAFKAGNTAAPEGRPGAGAPLSFEGRVKREQTAIKRTLKQIINDGFPDAGERAFAVLVEIMEDKEREAPARIAAAREVLNRRYGKPVEHRHVKRTGDTNGTTFNVQMFGADGARILEAVQSPEDRYRLAAMIDQMGQLEQTIDVTSVEITSGPEDAIEAEARPGPDVSTDNGIPM